jgi:hypothetical protein
MSPFLQVLFRLFVLVAGRFPAGSRLIRRLLLSVTRRGGKMTYVAHADFLDPRDLDPDGRPMAVVDPEQFHV